MRFLILSSEKIAIEDTIKQINPDIKIIFLNFFDVKNKIKIFKNIRAKEVLSPLKRTIVKEIIINAIITYFSFRNLI